MDADLITYTQDFHIKNPFAVETAVFLAATPFSLATLLIKNLPGLNADNKKKLRAKVKTYRDRYTKLLEEKKDYLAEWSRSFSAKGEELSKSVWTNKDVFAHYLRCWRSCMVTLSWHAIIMGDWEPKGHAPRDDYDLKKIKDAALMLAQSKYFFGEADINTVTIPEINMPGNVGLGFGMQVHLWVLTAFFQLGAEKFAETANKMISLTGMVVSYSKPDKTLNYRWKEMSCCSSYESIYIDTMASFSDDFKEMLVSAGDELPEWMLALIKQLEEHPDYKGDEEQALDEEEDEDEEEEEAAAGEEGAEPIPGVEVPAPPRLEEGEIDQSASDPPADPPTQQANPPNPAPAAEVPAVQAAAAALNLPAPTDPDPKKTSEVPSTSKTQEGSSSGTKDQGSDDPIIIEDPSDELAAVSVPKRKTNQAGKRNPMRQPGAGAMTVVTRDGTKKVNLNTLALGSEAARKSREAYEKIRNMYNNLKKGYKKFDDSMRCKREIPEKARFLLDQRPPAFIELFTDRLKVRDTPPTVHSIRVFCVENGLNEEEIEDAAFAGICVCLANAGALLPTMTTALPTVAEIEVKPKSQISDIKLPIWMNSARRMLCAALLYDSQSGKNGELSWYESYCKVYGRMMRVKRFCDVCESIISSGFLNHYVDFLTVGEVVCANNVSVYRYKRLSTPDVIMNAFAKVQNETIYRMIDPDVLMKYVKFVRAGVLGQIASGPLKSLCHGTINVLEVEDIADDVTIGELKPISEPPFDVRMIKQAYLIHKVFDTVPGKWYQGLREKDNMDARDNIFYSIVKAYKASEDEAAARMLKKETKIEDQDLMSEVETYQIVLETMKMRLLK